jgi:hypothetical protein
VIAELNISNAENSDQCATQSRWGDDGGRPSPTLDDGRPLVGKPRERCLEGTVTRVRATRCDGHPTRPRMALEPVSLATNHEATKRAIDTLQVADRTATGEGISSNGRNFLRPDRPGRCPWDCWTRSGATAPWGRR